MEKPLGMSLRDQDERDTEAWSHPTPGSEAEDPIAIPNGSDSTDGDGKDADEAAPAPAAMPGHSTTWAAPAVPTPESAAIAAKRAQLQAALRDRPRWMARPIPASAPAEPVEASQPDTGAEAPAELRDKMADATSAPYTPPDWKAVFGDHEEAAADQEPESESEQGGRSDEPSEPAEAAALIEPELPYLDASPGETASDQTFADLCYKNDETRTAATENPEAEALASGEDDEPQHVFAEPPNLLESPAAQEARRRFRAAYELYRAPYAAGTPEVPQDVVAEQHEAEPSYSGGHDRHDYLDAYEETQTPAAMAEEADYHYQPSLRPRSNPPSEALRRAAFVASSRSAAPTRALARRPQPFEGASSNMREALDNLNTRGRVARPDALRRTVARHQRSSWSMSGATVAAALLMSACGGFGIYAWKAGGLDAVMALIPAPSPHGPAQAAMVPHTTTPDAKPTATPPKVGDDDTDQQTDQPDEGPVVIESTTTTEGPTGALPEASKEETPPAEHAPPPLAEAPPVPEPVPPAAAAAPPRPAAAADEAKPQPTSTGKPTKKRFHTARLNVGDVEGIEQQSIPLNLSMDTGEGPADVQLRLSGLPEAAKLSAGQKLADGAWVVTAKDAAGLRLLTPDIEKPEHHTVAIEAVETRTGSLAAPTQEMQLSILPRKVIVEPAAASAENVPRSPGGHSQAVIELPGAQPAAVPPPAAPPEADATASIDKPAQEQKAAEPPAKPAKLPKLASLNAEPEVVPAKPAPAKATEPSAADDDLIARGDELLSLGDIVAARQLYEFAVDRGQMQAAVALGRTYDPVTFEKLKVRGLTPNPKLALEWYRKAEEAGVKGAQADIEALSAWLAR